LATPGTEPQDSATREVASNAPRRVSPHGFSITPEQALGIIFGLQKGMEQSMEKLANKDRGTGRTA
jgi:hypothetical protein